MTATDTERQAWVQAVSDGRTDKGLEEWLASDESLPTDNVVVICAGVYPAVRVAGYWYQVQRGGGNDPAKLKLVTNDEDLSYVMKSARAIIGRNADVIRGSLDA